MSKSLQKPTILNVETVARSRLFTVESVDLEFSNGVRRVYERMRPTNREAVMIVPIVDDHLILIREYAVGTESYELGFSKGLIDPGESVSESLEGDEPEPLPQVRWPLAHMMDLLEDPDFNEARNVSALFLVREWLKGQGRV